MSHSKPNALFWIIAIVFGLLWNAYGVYLFVFETFLATPELFAEMYTPEQLELKDNLPGWYTVVYGIATIGGLLGALCMVLRKRCAIPLFGISLLAILVNMCYGWLFTNAAEVYDPFIAYGMPLIVIIIGILLYFYSKGAAQKGWLT
ncbi:MAG TPA: hypothetical protein DEA82_10120 [Flavobacteriaceae bacterium]|jgi:uncharacterized membrane protein YphA (DoxX/SURF4 family)|nr:hypothetical protein [Flavobacteriaceae bacterium]MAM28960.1 hypothetical protein [Flavobacteriaceae bacterium]HBR54502.1 hypothetical protein [Flavobacteriaceae bacterium]|tara:strand:- start:1067 stop:1507 length:441 start_codon:yes stop_codon:yes gene_type:complete